MGKTLVNLFEKVKDKISTVDQKKLVLGIILFNALLLSVVIYFRFAVYDEKLFLQETVMMSEILKQGKWIGNYGVGVHGFIFKLPIALIFILTGPNIYIATFFHVILASLTVWIFYLFISENFKMKGWAVVAVIFLLTNYTFFSYSTTFHREIPVLFSLILFTYSLVKNKNRYLLNGLLLLLILEAKEYVFFAILIPLLIYIFVMNSSGFKKIVYSTVFSIKDFLLFLVPSSIYLYMMFYTSLIPVNMFNASFMGLTTSGFSYQIRHASPKNALSDMSTYTNENVGYNTVQDAIGDEDSVEEQNLATKINRLIITILGYALGYMEKLLYISNYSFQGIPFIIIILSLISSVYLFKEWLQNNKKLLFLNIFFWCYLFIFMIRASHERYILTILPFSIIFLVYFLIHALKNKERFRPYLVTSLVVSTMGLIGTIFYQDLSNIKELFNIFASTVMLSLLYAIFFSKKYRNFIVDLMVIFIVGASLFVSSYAIFSKNQIYKSLRWGINGEADKIAELLDEDDIVFTDCQSSVNSEFTYLINVYRANYYLPIEWHWKLDQHKVNRDLDAIKIEPNFYYTLDLEDLEVFQSEVEEKGINKLLLLESDLEGDTFPLEEYIDIFKNEDWLELDVVEQFKNKKVYMFNVVYEE